MQQSLTLETPLWMEGTDYFGGRIYINSINGSIELFPPDNLGITLADAPLWMEEPTNHNPRSKVYKNIINGNIEHFIPFNFGIKLLESPLWSPKGRKYVNLITNEESYNPTDERITLETLGEVTKMKKQSKTLHRPAMGGKRQRRSRKYRKSRKYK